MSFEEFININGSVMAISAITVGVLSFIGVLISIIMNHKHNKKSLIQQKEQNKENFKGNVVSKARIEWIQEVRKQSVEFISSCYILMNYIKLLKANGELTEDNHILLSKRIQSDESITQYKSDIEKSGTLLVLYFGPDSSGNNTFIEYIVHLITHKLDKFGEWYDVGQILDLEDSVIVLRDFLRIYLKAEWKRANGEIDDNELQIYLESHNLYNKILKIYQSGINSHKEWIDNYYFQLQLQYSKYDD
ncbi:hypothetical protein [Niallia sp. FSL W8-0954]|uniref:hypothetical protein n=1 Tax=Niallia sp. FSL W8-0954 TaxID=2975338 RepID=UPI0030F4E55C